MKTRAGNLILIYLLQPEDTTPGGSWRRVPQEETSTVGWKRLAAVKAVLWAAIALAMAYGVSRLSDTLPIH